MAAVFISPCAATVNFATSLLAHAKSRRAMTSNRARIGDRKTLALKLNLPPSKSGREERLELISKLVHFFKPTTGFHLTANSRSPSGARHGRLLGARHSLY